MQEGDGQKHINSEKQPVCRAVSFVFTHLQQFPMNVMLNFYILSVDLLCVNISNVLLWQFVSINKMNLNTDEYSKQSFYVTIYFCYVEQQVILI